MTLFEHISQHHQPWLKFTDAESGLHYSWDEISTLQLVPSSSNRKLCFLYLDNSITSVTTFFSFLGSPHCLCLLSADIRPELKENLEKNYTPEIIIDPKRALIEGYELDRVGILDSKVIQVFHCSKNTTSLHPDLKILLPTSGTTGSPKLVKLTDENFIANTSSILGYLPISETDSTPLNLPIHYSYGLSVLLTNTVHGGNIVCTNESILSRKFWEQFKTYKCNNFAGVPYTYEMLQRIGFTQMPDIQVKYFTQAGGKLDVKFRKIFAEYAQQHNAQFFVMYGQTEATARMSYLDPAYALSKIESIGKPIPGGKFSLDETTHELIYEGKNVFRGYANSKSDLVSLGNNKALRTGDLASCDEEGFYYITGRLNRFIKLFGNRVGLDEVEQALRKKFDGTLACAGVNDQFLLIFSDQAEDNEAEIKNYVSKLYDIHISAIRFKFVPQLPLNANHKIDYLKLLAEHGQ